MRRVMRKTEVGPFDNQVTRWVGSRQFTWEHIEHRKLRQKPCAHTKQKHKHLASKTNHQPCAKQDTNTQLLRKLISSVFTQDMTTWKHAADKNVNCMQQHKTCGQKSARPSKLKTAHSHNKTEHGVRVSEPRHETETQDTSQDPNTMVQHKTRHTNERAHGSSTLKATHSHKNRTRRECQGSVTKSWITLDWSDRTLRESTQLYYNVDRL